MATTVFEKFLQSYANFFSGHLRTMDSTHLNDERQAELNWAGTHWKLMFRRGQGVMEFVPAIQTRRASGKVIEDSIGVVPDIPVVTQADDFGDLMEVGAGLNEQAQSKSPFRPVGAPGYRYETDVLTVRIPNAPVIQYLSEASIKPNGKNLAAAAISFDAAFTMAAAAELELELSDFGRTWRLLPDEIRLYYYDVSPGGNGIAETIFQDWTGPRRAAQLAAETIMRSDCCPEYCDRCILLPRMPESFVRRGLLSKLYARALVRLA